MNVNYFYLLLFNNKHFLPFWVENIINNMMKINPVRNPDVNFFNLYGMSEDVFNLIFENLKKNKGDLQIPMLSNNNANHIVNGGEGFFGEDFISNLHFLIDIFGENYKWTFVNDCINKEELYKNFCVRTRQDKKLDLVTSSGAFLNPKHVFYTEPIDNSWQTITDKRLFCNFNWSNRDFRWAVIALLQYKDLIKDGHISSPVELHHEAHTVDVQRNDLLKAIDKYLTAHPNLSIIKEMANKLNLPLNIDDRTIHNRDKEFQYHNTNFKLPLYHARYNSYIELINETCFAGEHFFTEKTFIPILLNKPFLIVSSYKTLECLRQMGYQTFSPVINEDYDNEPDNFKRMCKIIDELDRLRKMYYNQPNDFHRAMNNLKNITEHNRTKFTC